MNLLVLSPTPSSSASTRFRLEQFFPALRGAGVEPVLRPFLDERGFAALYRRGAAATKALAAGRALAGRITDLARATRAQAVLIHREAALIGPPLLEWLITRLLDRAVIFDLDDPVWVPYSSPTYGALLSRLLKAPAKTHFTLRAAARVIAGNPHVAAYARRFNARTEIIPTVVDTDRFRPNPRRESGVPVIGWIGTHSSLQYLRAIAPALARVAARRRFVLRVVGAELHVPGVDVENLPWSLQREVSDFQSLDIGLYPLVEDEWALGKSGFKAVQYMACGVPTIASPVGVTSEMIEDGENGFLARSADDWVSRIEELLASAELRRRIGDCGRDAAVARWSLAAHAPRFVEVVQTTMRNAS